MPRVNREEEEKVKAVLGKWARQRMWTGTCDSVEWQRTAGQCDYGPRDECRCWPDDLEDVMWDEACALVEGEQP